MTDIQVDLQNDGVLWAINKTVFHPRGFALALDPDGNLFLHGDGSERWLFEAETERLKSIAFESLLRRGGSRVWSD